MKSKTILGADGATKMRQITVGIHGKGGEAGIKAIQQLAGMTDKNGQPIAKVNYGTSGKPERTLLGRTVVLCDYVASYSAALAKDTIFAFLFNFKDYVLNTNYSMGVKKYEDNDTDDQITKGIMLVDGKVVDKNSLVVVKKIEAV